MVDVPPDRPQKGKDAEKFGSYNLAIRVLNAEVNPGDEIKLEVFITGYGTIRGAKFVFIPPLSFIDPEESRLIYGVKERNGKLPPTDIVEWGGHESGLYEGGFIIQLGGLWGHDAWNGRHTPWGDEATSFWDAKGAPESKSRDTDDAPGSRTPAIATEMMRNKAPMEIYLKTRKRPWWGRLPFLRSGPGIFPGTHSFQGHLTYFNGDQWKSASQSVSVVVPNFFRRHEGITWAAGIVGVLFAVMSLSLNIADKWGIVSTFLVRLWRLFA